MLLQVVRTKHKRSGRLFEECSILFLIIEHSEFLTLRFYDVCEHDLLEHLESSRLCLHPVGHSPLHVQSVEETRHIISDASS